MNAPYFLEHIWLIPLFPLLTAAVMLFYGRQAREQHRELFVRRERVCFVHFFGGRVFSAGGAA